MGLHFVFHDLWLINYLDTTLLFLYCLSMRIEEWHERRRLHLHENTRHPSLSWINRVETLVVQEQRSLFVWWFSSESRITSLPESRQSTFIRICILRHILSLRVHTAQYLVLELQSVFSATHLVCLACSRRCDCIRMKKEPYLTLVGPCIRLAWCSMTWDICVYTVSDMSDELFRLKPSMSLLDSVTFLCSLCF